jgi:hypothetical protein
MVQHVSFSPSLYSLHHSMTRFTRNDLRDLRREGQANWPFLLQVDVAGDGYTTNNIKMNTKWLRNTSRSYPNYTPLHHTFYVMISVTFERKGHAKCGLSFCKFTLLGMGIQHKISKWILVMACGYCTCFIMLKHVPFSPNLYTTAWHVLLNDLRDLPFWKTCKLAIPSAGWRCWGWVYNIEMAIYRQVQILDISISVSILYRCIGIDCVRYLSG